MAGGAALLAGLLTSRRSAEQARAAARGRAYIDVMMAAGSVALHSRNIRVLLEIESGVKSSLAFRSFRRASTIELLDYLRQPSQDLLAASAGVWASGSQAAIDLVNELVDCSSKLMGIGTDPGLARSAVVTTLRGQGWTDEQDEALGEAISAIARLRHRFGLLARKETGMPDAALFASDRTESDSVHSQPFR